MPKPMPMPIPEEEEISVTAILAEERRKDRQKRKREQKKKRTRYQKKKQKRPMKITPYKTGDRVNLRSLLCNKTRDYLINNKGERIKVCDLENKVVALYLYEEGFTDDLTETLKIAYKQLVSVDKKMFEVVLVYMYDSWNTHKRTDAEIFNQTFKTMPWLALPFKDINSAMLPSIFRYPFELDEWHPDPSLVIIGPRGEFVVPFGAATILKNYGFQAYPFTREKAYRLHAERVKDMKLEMLWDPKTVFIRKHVYEEVRVPFTDIIGKRIMVFCECHFNQYYRKFKMKLLQRYMETKGRNDEFEVIHVGVEDGEAVPWLRPPSYFGGSPAVRALSRVLNHGYGILAFDRDGKVVRATSKPKFETEDGDFPFYAGSLEEEVRIYLAEMFLWDDGDSIFLN